MSTWFYPIQLYPNEIGRALATGATHPAGNSAESTVSMSYW